MRAGDRRKRAVLASKRPFDVDAEYRLPSHTAVQERRQRPRLLLGDVVECRLDRLAAFDPGTDRRQRVGQP
ncbi:hypothetical protein ACFQH8_18420 [Halomicroarcula sp. GCM10025710]